MEVDTYKGAVLVRAKYQYVIFLLEKIKMKTIFCKKVRDVNKKVGQDGLREGWEDWAGYWRPIRPRGLHPAVNSHSDPQTEA